MSNQNILTEVDGKVAIITLNRPQVLNAIDNDLMDELVSALQKFDADDQIACMIVTGSEKAFAAGADVSKMASLSFNEVYRQEFITRNWDQIRKIRKPIIAAVSVSYTHLTLPTIYSV